MKEYQHSGTGKPWLQSQPRLRSIQVISAATLGERLPWIEFHWFGFQQRPDLRWLVMEPCFSSMEKSRGSER